jgi:hypothetical protein
MLGGDVPWRLQNELADGENSRHMADGQRRAPASWVYRAFGDSQGVVSLNSGRRAEAPAFLLANQIEPACIFHRCSRRNTWVCPLHATFKQHPARSQENYSGCTP